MAAETELYFGVIKSQSVGPGDSADILVVYVINLKCLNNTINNRLFGMSRDCCIAMVLLVSRAMQGCNRPY